MEMITIAYAVLIIGGLGLAFGIVLTVASKKLAVEDDPIITAIREALPGANCGGCSFTGCDLFAQAVVTGNAKPNACTVGGEKTTVEISNILGIEAEIKEREVACVACAGNTHKSNFRYDYFGMDNCKAAMQLSGGGSKACPMGCLGYGSCKGVCKFGAIDIIDGIAVINPDKCTACGQCVKICPKEIIQLTPYSGRAKVMCSSHQNGKEVRANCTVGCIGCKICEKQCEFDAIHVTDFLAVIDTDKCTGCNKCVEKCPMKAIKPA